MREKYGVLDEWVIPFEVIPIIDVPEYGSMSAVKACEDLKIQSQNDTVKLAEAKSAVYMKVGCTFAYCDDRHVHLAVVTGVSLSPPRASLTSQGSPLPGPPSPHRGSTRGP